VDHASAHLSSLLSMLDRIVDATGKKYAGPEMSEARIGSGVGGIGG